MTGKGGFSDKLRLKEMAEEDIYFARRERELIEAIHRRNRAGRLGEESDAQRGLAEAETDEEPGDVSGPPGRESRKPAGRLRHLLGTLFRGFRGRQ